MGAFSPWRDLGGNAEHAKDPRAGRLDHVAQIRRRSRGSARSFLSVWLGTDMRTASLAAGKVCWSLEIEHDTPRPHGRANVGCARELARGRMFWTRSFRLEGNRITRYSRA